MASSRIQCPRCGLERNWLRVLPCKHQLCMTCIRARCPQCNQPIPSPQSGPSGSNLPIKFAGPLVCPSCSKTKAADDFWYCEDCVELLCSGCCIRNHSKHQTHDWNASLRPLQHCSSALNQYSHLEDPMGNQAQLKELIKPVYRHLSSLINQKGLSVATMAVKLENGYSIQRMEEGGQSSAAEGKLENHLQVAKQALVLTNLMKQTDPVLTKLRGFKQDPSAIAKLLFNQLDFGRQTPISEAAQVVQARQPMLQDGRNARSVKPVQVVRLRGTCRPLEVKRSFSVQPAARMSFAQAAAKGGNRLPNKAFHIPIRGPVVPSVVFGSSRFLALLTHSSIHVWTIGEDGDPTPKGSVIREACNQSFVDAAISERGGWLLGVSKTNDQWDMLIFELSNWNCLKTIQIDQGSRIRSSCLGATDTAVAYLVLNSIDDAGSVFGQFYRLSQVPPHHQKEFRLLKLQMNSVSFKRVAAKCIGKLRHLVAALEVNQPCVHMYAWTGKSLESTQTISLMTGSPLLNIAFRTDEDSLFICSQDRFQWWSFNEGVGKMSFDFGIKAGGTSSIGILDGQIVAAIDQTDHFRFVFFHLKGLLWVPRDD